MTAFIIRRLSVLPIVFLGVRFPIFGMLPFLGLVEHLAIFVHDIPQTDQQIEDTILSFLGTGVQVCYAD